MNIDINAASRCVCNSSLYQDLSPNIFCLQIRKPSESFAYILAGVCEFPNVSVCTCVCVCIYIDIKQLLDASTSYWDNAIELTVKHNHYLLSFAPDSQ